MARQALFAELIFDEADNQVQVAHVGGEAFYVVDDNGFLRHIEAEKVDRQVLLIFLEQLHDHRDLAVEQMLRMMGQDDLFTKAALDATLDNISIDQILAQGIPPQARDMLGMLGFRVIINVHGDLVRLDQPTATDEE